MVEAVMALTQDIANVVLMALAMVVLMTEGMMTGGMAAGTTAVGVQHQHVKRLILDLVQTGTMCALQLEHPVLMRGQCLACHLDSIVRAE